MCSHLQAAVAPLANAKAMVSLLRYDYAVAGLGVRDGRLMAGDDTNGNNSNFSKRPSS